VIPTPNYYIWRTLVSDYSLLTAHNGTGVFKTENFGENWIDMSDGLDLYTGKITILLPLDNFEPAYYDMFNSLGNNIIENMLICEPEQSVELSGFSKGIYFYRIHKKGKVLFSGKVLLH